MMNLEDTESRNIVYQVQVLFEYTSTGDINTFPIKIKPLLLNYFDRPSLNLKNALVILFTAASLFMVFVSILPY